MTTHTRTEPQIVLETHSIQYVIPPCQYYSCIFYNWIGLTLHFRCKMLLVAILNDNKVRERLIRMRMKEVVKILRTMKSIDRRHLNALPKLSYTTCEHDKPETPSYHDDCYVCARRLRKQ